MDRPRLEAMLAATRLGLEKDEDSYRASIDRPMTVLAHIGTDLVRFPKVVAIHFDPELGKSDLIGLVREESYLVIGVDVIEGVEREQKPETSERRRTGFV